MITRCTHWVGVLSRSAIRWGYVANWLAPGLKDESRDYMRISPFIGLDAHKATICWQLCRMSGATSSAAWERPHWPDQVSKLVENLAEIRGSPGVVKLVARIEPFKAPLSVPWH